MGLNRMWKMLHDRWLRHRVSSLGLATAAISWLWMPAAAHAGLSPTFTLDPDASQITVDATVESSGFRDSDNQTTGVTGTMTATLGAAAAPFEQLRLTQADWTPTEPLDLTFFEGNLLGTLSATSSGLGVTLDEADAGPAATVTDGAFNQTANTLRGEGIIDVTGDGLFGSVDERFDLDGESVESELAGSISRANDVYELVVAFEDATFTETFSSGGVSGEATVTLNGDLLGTAPVRVGDMNGDGQVDNLDINPFVLALTDAAAFEAQFGVEPVNVGDVNADGQFNNLDINPFVATLTDGASIRAVPEPGSLGLLTLGGAMLFRGCRRRAAAWPKR